MLIKIFKQVYDLGEKKRVFGWTERYFLLTLIPHGSVASSSMCRMTSAVCSLSDRISERFLVPRTFLRVVEASSCVERPASLTLHTAASGFWRKRSLIM